MPLGTASLLRHSKCMRILVADDNSEIRAALRLLLGELGELDISEAGDVDEALRAVSSTSVEIVLLDWELAGSSNSRGEANSAGFVREAKRKAPGCRVIAMSVRPEAQAESSRAGCDGFVSRTDSPDRLLALLGLE
jgi:DNA-binding NarL/FixJ family response regulator